MARIPSQTVTASPVLAGLLTLTGVPTLRRRPVTGLLELALAAAAVGGISDSGVERGVGLATMLVALSETRARRRAGDPWARLIVPAALGVLGWAAVTGTTLVLDADGDVGAEATALERVDQFEDASRDR